MCEFKTGLGKFCQVDQDCKQINNTACSSKNTCQCKPNFVAQNEECKPSTFANFLSEIFILLTHFHSSFLVIGAPCETANDCVFENAECKAEVTVVNEKDSDKDSEIKFCSCKKKSIQVDDQCLDEGMIGRNNCLFSKFEL